MKAQLPLKVEIELKASLSNEAVLDGRSLNNYVEMLLNTHPAREGFKFMKKEKKLIKKLRKGHRAPLILGQGQKDVNDALDKQPN